MGSFSIDGVLRDMDRVGITFDIDWASDAVVEYVVALLEQYHLKATFFATHDSDLLRSLDKRKYEVGIHPAFKGRSDDDQIVKDLMALYPGAVGVRSHALAESSETLRLFVANGLKYDVNTFIPFREGLYPFMRFNTLVRIPYYWEDDAHFSAVSTFELDDLRIDKVGLKIYNFHPIHLYMNTSSPEHYQTYKPFYHETESLLKHRNKGRGIWTLFTGLVDYLTANRLPTMTCNEICDEYLAGERDR